MAKKLPGLALYLAHGNVLTAGNMDSEKATGKSFECVELGDVGTKKQKVPRKIIHFASGETMEEYSTDEEAGEIENRDLLPAIDTSQLTWGPYLWFYMLRAATGTLSVCDFLGERVASLFGINTPKYQYAIDEYYRIKKEEEEEEEENQMSEAAEKHYREQMEKQQEVISSQDSLPAASPSFVNVGFEIENEPTNITESKARRDSIPA
ncbi:protein FAM177A1 isoform X2 [Callorhinchus milii]|uniref:protein FAM177A1 isoform X2 n=1 Tax=Callorhinchus milii TaxID=7868 RepID=UPI0004571BA3|nr:protein FAM177A1 isoform X2 [Callorhinchus milii]|eukprot:gi/632951855/ref/XP_007891527.1/ PREDICTED: protein FAM177A1 isoform X2 [Callorhinchus milii]